MLRRLSLVPAVLVFLLAAEAARAVPCPGTGAKLKVIVNNPTTSTGQVVTISGNAISSQVTCTDQQDTYSRTVTLTQLGDNEFLIPSGGGLDTGMWVNHISAGTQYQHQQRPVLIAASPADYATVRWTYYPTVLSVTQSGDAGTGDCIFLPTCTFRQAIASANLLAQFTGTPAILIQFALSPGTMTQATTMSIGVAGSTRIIAIDGTDANGDPWIVGDGLAAAQGNQDVFTRAIDLANTTRLEVSGNQVTIKGLAISNTVSSGTPSSPLITENAGAAALRVEAVRLDGGATGSCGSCLTSNATLLELLAGAQVVNIEGRAARSHAARVLGGDPLSTEMRDSWLHHNYASGVFGDGIQLTRNLIELSGRRADGTVVTTAGVGFRPEGASRLRTSANVIRNHTAAGILANPNILGPQLAKDYVCGNGANGIELEEGAGATPPVSGTGLGLVYNDGVGLHVANTINFMSTLTFNNDSTFTANALCGLGNASSIQVNATNNQWRTGSTSSCTTSPDYCAGTGPIDCDPVQDPVNTQIVLDAQATFPDNALLKGQTLRVQGSGFNAVAGNPVHTLPAANCALGSGDVSSNNCCRKKTKANVCVTVPLSPPNPPADGSNCAALRDAANRWFPLAVTSVTPTTIVTEVPDPVHLCTGDSAELVRVIKQGAVVPIQAQASHCRNTSL